nr:hypothetical protein CFP56_72129 [Quercus suber]
MHTAMAIPAMRKAFSHHDSDPRTNAAGLFEDCKVEMMDDDGCRFAAGLGGVGQPGSCLLAVLHSAYTISVCYRDHISKAYVEGWAKASIIRLPQFTSYRDLTPLACPESGIDGLYACIAHAPVLGFRDCQDEDYTRIESAI